MQTVVLLATVGYLLAVYVLRWRRSPLYRVPSVGGPFFPLLSYFGGLHTLFRGKQLIQYGYKKYGARPFKIPLLSGWVVIVSDPEVMEDIKTRPENQLWLTQALMNAFPSYHVTGQDLWEDTWLHGVILKDLTRSISSMIPELMDELEVVAQEFLPSDGDGWVSLNPNKTSEEIVIRAVNRGFVGFPTCRNKEYLNSVAQYTHGIVTAWASALIFPILLTLPIGRFFNAAPNAERKCTELLKALLDERRELIRKKLAGDDSIHVPTDMLQFCVEEGVKRDYSDERIMIRIMATNLGAIHTTSMALTNALYDLAAHPQYAQPLRDEIAPIVAAEGWTKAALSKMWKVDSFLKESHRYNGMAVITMLREAMTDVVLADGTIIPKGTKVGVPTYSIQHNEEKYPDPDAFDPFRFARMRERGGNDETKHQLSTTSLDWVGFGHGKQSCPGRFFAANELRAILAYIVLNYDLKLVGGGPRPKNFFFAVSLVPPQSGRILVRKRTAIF
ncbi:cytochrome P450 [Lentinus tigrinus ALCF2SS1-7]|uniref:cytochrome P450 n=1 Tax=Lentinus tigrinus ALCF2SS1-7 TaxID=1328758 RepID=UPI001166067D|nr:cytochrome P450 [Lentinus tigrinus ALCF2SS1-7]